MKCALIIYKYFARGGAQRDLQRTAQALLERNVQVEIICAHCTDPIPEGCFLSVLACGGTTNHGKMKVFEAAVARHLQKHPVDVVLGFSRMQGLDLYFAADDCLYKHWQNKLLNMLLPRRRTFLQLEKAAMQSPVILSLTARQERDYQFYYQLTQDKFQRMPTGIDRKYQTFERSAAVRKRVRKELSVAEDRFLIVQAAASFHTKGVDRTLSIISQLPEDLKKNITVIVAGDDRRREKYSRLAQMLNLDVRFPGGLDNLEEIYTAADLLLHPARNEATGTVFIEALCCNLPVLTTNLCGYAEYIEAAGGGVVLPEPFQLDHWVLALKKLLTEVEHLQQCRKNTADMYKNDFWYSRPAVMADAVIRFAEQKKVSEK